MDSLRRILIFGNSGSGKSTLAKQINCRLDIPHFDLDCIAWRPSVPPSRRPLDESRAEILRFTNGRDEWVIEGCYADLLELAAPFATEAVFLNLPINVCLSNARRRPWEPHKYESKEAQDANLVMLLDWISQYESRTDEFSLSAHTQFFESFKGKKMMLRENSSFFD
ncbi:MAG: AAA family ATPase [Pseudomonadota bacterium]